MITERRVDTKHGCEGPRHDPYSYIEITVKTNIRTVILHSGLAEWVEVDGVREDLSEEECLKRFYELTGFSNYLAIEKAMEKRVLREMNPCCKKYAEWAEGFPGESLLICQKCKKVLDYSFNEAAVI